MTPHPGLTLPLLLAACGPGSDTVPGATATPELPADPTVLVVVIDGARTIETFGDRPSSATGQMPWEMMPTVWDELMPQAVRATQAWVLASSSTVPAHGALITGRREPASANYPPGDGPGAYLPVLPTVAQALRDEQPVVGPGAAVTIANTRLLELLADGLYPGLPRAETGSWTFLDSPQGDGDGSKVDSEVLDALRVAMADGGLRYGLVNLHQVDRAGHNGERDDYPDRVRDLDEPIAALWRWVQDQDAYRDRTYLLVLSDHGRHTDGGTDPPWRHHGCSCSGCRHVPLLLLGPGVRAGEDVNTPLLMVDVAPTLAALLGVGLPWADGLVRDDLLLAPTGHSSRLGVADISVAGDHTAELRYSQDPGQRTVLYLDGQRITDHDVTAVEMPSLATHGDDVWACWRQVTASTGAAKVAWEPHCVVSQDGGIVWQSFDFAQSKAGPYGRIALHASDQGLVAAWVHSPSGSTDGSVDPKDEGSTVSLRIARLTERGWQEAEAPGTPSFPTDLSLAWDGERYHIAVAGGDPGAGNAVRHTRRVWMSGITPDGDGFTWGEPAEVDLDALAPEDDHWRLEYPSLSILSDGRLALAVTGIGSQGSDQAIVAVSDDGDAGFSSQITLDHPGVVMPNTGPAWLGDRAVFPVMDTDTNTASLCAGDVGGEFTCVSTGSPRVLRLLSDPETLYAVVDEGVGDWDLRQWEAGSFGTR
jgi:hypothetical protein